MHPTHRTEPLPAGQYVSDGGGTIWFPREREYHRMDFRGWRFVCTDFRGATFIACDVQGADLARADLRGARIWQCDLSSAQLDDVILAGAYFDRFTRWPTGFDPQVHGAVLVVPAP